MKRGRKLRDDAADKGRDLIIFILYRPGGRGERVVAREDLQVEAHLKRIPRPKRILIAWYPIG